ncbi:MAG: glutamate-5-semialdehyde dehydrogenase, partial [Candidatus Hydrogenedentota bacterium]
MTATSAIQEEVLQIGRQAREAGYALRSLTCAPKDRALRLIAQRLRDSSEYLQKENAKDLEAGRANGLNAALLDRLELTDKRIEAMAKGLEVVADLSDPVGDIVGQTIHPNGLRIARVRQPLGVVGIIYESRPNVTADAAGLCLKSGNACILRGGSEAIHSNLAIAQIFIEGAGEAGIPQHAVQIIGSTDREAVGAMLQLDSFIDVIVPRGGKGLITRIMRESMIPVVAHLDGVCHTYVDESADLEMACTVCVNAKMQRPGVCNAMETMLVHEAVAERFLPDVARRLAASGCELRGCARTQTIVDCKEADDEDWITEYLDAILAIRVVDSFAQAVNHINFYGS